MNEEILGILKRQIDAIVDRWVSTVLRDRLLSGTSYPEKRSLWDRFKQGVANWWYGPQGEDENPYKWRNRFGNALGVSESFDPSVFTLKEYSEIKGLLDSAERKIDESEDFEKLKIAQIIRSAAQELKGMLFDALRQSISSASSSQHEKPIPNKATGVSRVRRRKEDTATPPTRRERKGRRKRVAQSGGDETEGGGTATVPASSVGATNAGGTPPTDGTASASAEDGGGRTMAEPTGVASSTSGQGATQATAVRPRSSGRSEDDQEEKQNPELASFVEKDGVKSLRRVGEKISKFLVDMSGDNQTKKKELLSWWKKTWETNKKINNTQERLNDIEARLVIGSGWVEDISQISGVSTSDIKKMMVDFIKKDDDQ